MHKPCDMLLSAVSSRPASMALRLRSAISARKMPFRRVDEDLMNRTTGKSETTIIEGYQPPPTRNATLSGTKAAASCTFMPRSNAKLRVHMLSA